MTSTKKFLKEVKVRDDQRSPGLDLADELKGSTILVIIVSVFFAVYIGIVDLAASRSSRSLYGCKREFLRKADYFENDHGLVCGTYIVGPRKQGEDLSSRLRLPLLRSSGEQIGRIVVPTEDTIEMKDGKKKTTKRKFLPSYVLIEMELNKRHPVSSSATYAGMSPVSWAPEENPSV